MKLGLLGYPVDHSKSPELYKRFLAEKLESYRLFSYSLKDQVPDLSFFNKQLDGLNITSPYKAHFVEKVKIDSPLVRRLGFVNTLAFTHNETMATNTDLLAVVEILQNYYLQFPNLYIQLLGDGAMAQVTIIVAQQLGIPLSQYSRRLIPDFEHLSLPEVREHNGQVLIINACSRNFIFDGPLRGDELFWDYNYSFPPHADKIPSQLKSYQDGLELLEKQALYAIKFWSQYNSKLSTE